MKRSGNPKKELTIEIEQAEEMTKEDLDELLHVMATIIVRKAQKAESSADDTER